MAILKCKMCGGDLNITADETVVECEYCGSKQTVPTADNEKKMNLYTRANRLLRNCEFDKAAGIYESIVAEFPEEAEAYWGLVLCKYGIEYVDDPTTGNKVPTCHRSSFDSVMDDKDFELVMEYADGIARRVYREQAKQMEELRKAIIEVSGKEEPYDIFISYKETDDSGERTLDSVIAQDIYTELTGKGYRVFFSRISLEDKLGTEYEPYIFAALNSAKVMLVVGTDYDYFNAVWVKNEWSRFLALIAKGEKKILIPVFKNIDAYDMPKEFAKLSAQDMGKVGAMQDLLRGVDKILGKTTQPAATTAQPQTVIQQVVGGSNCTALLERGYMCLEDEEFDEAEDIFKKCLKSNSKCAEAYLGYFMATIYVSNIENAKELFVSEDYTNDTYWRRAKQFAKGDLSKQLSSWEDERKIRIENERIEAEREENEYRMKQEAIEAMRRQVDGEKEAIFDEMLATVREKKNELEKAKEEFQAMPEHAEKTRLEKEQRQAEDTLSGLVIFKFKEIAREKEELKQLKKEFRTVCAVIDERNQDLLKKESDIKIATEEAIKTFLGYKQIGSTIKFGWYPQNEHKINEPDITDPIEWCVLDEKDGKILLLSRYILKIDKYYREERLFSPEFNIREWLNNEFYNNAFSNYEKNLISTSTLEWRDHYSFSYSMSNYSEKIFVLSLTEAQEYFKDDEARICLTTKYSTPPYSGNGEEEKYSWWLRTIGEKGKVAFIRSDGSINFSGYERDSLNGIRPAMWIDLNVDFLEE